MPPNKINNGIIRSTATGVVAVASAYAARNVVGGLLTFPECSPLDSCGGTINAAILKDKSGQAGTYDLFLFDQAPANFVDHAAVALSAADLAKCIGTLPFSAVVLGAAATMGISTNRLTGESWKSTIGTSLFGVLVCNGTPTYAAAADVSIDLFIQPDWRE